MRPVGFRIAWFLASLVALVYAPARSGNAQDDPKAPLSALLDDFHDAASKADFDRYMSRLDDRAVFIGTDATERWDREAFAAFVKPHFDNGTGWTYSPRDRNIDFIGEGSEVAMFDELLDNARYGECRGTGVLVRTDAGEWKIAQYALTIPVPNDVAAEVVALIQKRGRGG